MDREELKALAQILGLGVAVLVVLVFVVSIITGVLS